MQFSDNRTKGRVGGNYMNMHILLPLFNNEKIITKPEYIAWIEEWLYTIEKNIENGDIAISECFQGLASELAMYGEIKTDWAGVINEYLTDESKNPIAYSEQYGNRLFNFTAQWKQTTINAIYNHRWIIKTMNCTEDVGYVDLIRSFIQSNGWIYNHNVSDTQIRTRMKSELLMSIAMGTEILSEEGISDDEIKRFSATICGCPMTGYIGTEYFRLKALKNIGRTSLRPVDYSEMIKSCETEIGYCDFDVNQKIDDYMGTKKRTQRDKSIHSPLISLFVYELLEYCNKDMKDYIMTRLSDYADYLEGNPLDIPSFRMRDIEAPFGTGITPLEIISSSIIIRKF